MFCRNCGTEFPNGNTFCPMCGANNDVPYSQQYTNAPNYQAPQQNNNAPYYAQPVGRVQVQQADPTAQELSKTALTWGIVAACFCWCFVGIILGCIGLKKCDEFIAYTGMSFGRAKVGHILCKVGIIAGIAFSIFWVIYSIIICSAFSAIGNMYLHY